MIKIVVSKFYGFNKAQLEMAKQGLTLLENCVNSYAFSGLVLSWNFKGVSSETVLHRLLSGSDSMDERADETFNVAFTMHWKPFSHVVGWFNSGVRMIHMNKKYVNTADKFASNCLHEYAHMCGYSHDSASDRKSVPYAMNDIFKNWYSGAYNKYIERNDNRLFKVIS